MPPHLRARTLVSQVASPTCSKTTSTPRRSVIFLISSLTSCLLRLMTWAAPSSLAISSLSSLLATAMALALNSLQIWTAIVPRPPPAPQTSTKSPGLIFALRHEHPPGGEEDQRHRCRLLPAEVLRLGHDVEGGHLGVLGVGAVERAGLEAPYLELTAEEDLAAGAGLAGAAANAAEDDDLVADLDVGDLAADLDDLARRVAARDVRHDDRHAGQAAARPDVVVVAAGGPHLDQHLVRVISAARARPCTSGRRCPRALRRLLPSSAPVLSLPAGDRPDSSSGEC